MLQFQWTSHLKFKETHITDMLQLKGTQIMLLYDLRKHSDVLQFKGPHLSDVLQVKRTYLIDVALCCKLAPHTLYLFLLFCQFLHQSGHFICLLLQLQGTLIQLQL